MVKSELENKKDDFSASTIMLKLQQDFALYFGILLFYKYYCILFCLMMILFSVASSILNNLSMTGYSLFNPFNWFADVPHHKLFCNYLSMFLDQLSINYANDNMALARVKQLSNLFNQFFDTSNGTLNYKLISSVDLINQAMQKNGKIPDDFRKQVYEAYDEANCGSYADLYILAFGIMNIFEDPVITTKFGIFSTLVDADHFAFWLINCVISIKRIGLDCLKGSQSLLIQLGEPEFHIKNLYFAAAISVWKSKYNIGLFYKIFNLRHSSDDVLKCFDMVGMFLFLYGLCLSDESVL